jgi:membrane-associated phospholipid phosphatase
VTDQPLSPASPVHPFLPKHVSTTIIGLSLVLIVVLFAALGHVDHPTLNIVHGFTDPLVDQVGDIGNELGEGVTLVFLSVGMGAIGFWLHSARWKGACFYTLLAHGISGLFTQILKHSLSRPRPRIMDTTPWDIRPSFESGLDSFPSGHTSASFSIATVLAAYFPKARVLWFGLASFIAMCRVIKGSHFPTDILGGILLGIGSGLILIYARDQWKDVTTRAFVHGLPWLATAFGLLWILVPHPGIELEPDLSLFIGLVLLVVGMGLRLWWLRNSSIANAETKVNVPTWPRLLMGLGLATSTGSFIVVGAGILAGTVWWLGTTFEVSAPRKIQQHETVALNPIWGETALGTAMFIMALIANIMRSFYV